MKKLWLLLGALLVGGAAMAASSATKQSSTDTKDGNTGNGSTGGSGELLITDFDSVWDYKRVNGVWFTKKKSSSTWLNMKDSLSTANYEEAMTRLDNYISRKGLLGVKNSVVYNV